MRVTEMGRLKEFRCHIGHRMGLRTMIDEKPMKISRMLQAAQAQTEELRELLGFALDEAGPDDLGALTREFGMKENLLHQIRAITESEN